MVGIIGKKLGMSQLFVETGEVLPVTVVAAGPCKVLQVKTTDKDGYEAVQLGFEEKPERLASKPLQGHVKKVKAKPYRTLQEFRQFEAEYCEPGKEVKADVFKPGDRVKVTSQTKGKGFQGVVKRYNFHGGPKTHGQSDRLRSPGSIGQSADPSRVFKGLKMPGRTGGRNTTIKNLVVVKVDTDKNLLFIKGAIPGARNSIVTIRRQSS